MYRHTTIKIILCRTHLHRDPKALQHLSGADTDDMQTNDALLGARTNDLVGGGGLVLEHGIVHRRKLRLVDFDVLVTVFLASLRLGETDRADLRMCEHDGGDAGVVKLGKGEFRSSKEAVREPAAGGDGN